LGVAIGQRANREQTRTVQRAFIQPAGQAAFSDGCTYSDSAAYSKASVLQTVIKVLYYLILELDNSLFMLPPVVGAIFKWLLRV